MFSKGVATCVIQLGWKQPAVRGNKFILIRHSSDRAKLIHETAGKEESFSSQHSPSQSVHYHEISPTIGLANVPRSSDIAVRRIGLLDYAKSKLYAAQTFYDEFSGMSEVKEAQQKVIDIQDRLQLVQDRRRHILLELTLVRKKLQDIHIELQKATRGEHRYVELIKQEFEVMASEKNKQSVFDIIDQEERELFSHLTASVKTSHEKERTQANNVKYWSIIASGIGAMLGIVATSINYLFRNTQFETIQRTAEETNQKLHMLEQKLSSLETSLVGMNDRLIQQLNARRVLDQRAMVRAKPESWGSYFSRHLGRLHRYVRSYF